MAESRVPPHDLDAEAAVLSAVLLDTTGEARALARAELGEGAAFYADANRRIWEAIVGLERDGRPVDVVTVATWLRGHGRLDQVGGTAYLAQVADATPAVAHVEAHARLIVEKARCRALVALSQRFAAEGYAEVPDVQKWLLGAARAVSDLASEAGSKDPAETLAELIPRVSSSVAERSRLGTELRGIDTGFSLLNNLNSGWTAGLHVLAGRPGMGKALDVDARVLTPRGWKRMGDLAVGDEAIGSDGKPHAVLGVYDQGEREAYRVTMDDGASVVCDAEHLWFTRTRRDRIAGRTGAVRTTSELRRSLVRGSDGGRNHSLPYVAPVEFAGSGRLPLHPYVLGILLGDGGFQRDGVTLHNPERDVRARVAELLPAKDAFGWTNEVSARIVGGSTAAAIESLGLKAKHSWEKWVPEPYLFAEREARLELLRGLCDSDGFVTTGNRSVEFTTTSEALALDVEFLVRGLGGAVSRTQRAAHYVANGERHEARDSWRMVLGFPRGDIVPVSSRKHLAKWEPGPHRVAERFVASIDHIGRRQMRCIAVAAPDNLFVTEGFILTHNTSAMLCACMNVARQGFGVVLLSAEMPKEDIAERMLAVESNTDLSKIRTGRMNAGEWSSVLSATSRLQKLPMVVHYCPGATVAELRGVLRKEARRLPALGLVAVDYIQILDGERRGSDSRETEVAGISKGLLWMSQEFRVALVAASQINRAVESRSDKRPMLSDLRESGSIEQDAHSVSFLYRDEYYNKKTDEPGVVEWHLAKQRQGPTGVVKLAFKASSTLVATLESDRQQSFDDYDFGSSEADRLDEACPS